MELPCNFVPSYFSEDAITKRQNQHEQDEVVKEISLKAQPYLASYCRMQSS